MPRKSDKPLEKIILNFYEGDADLLRKVYPQIGYSVAIREIVHQACNKIRERVSREGVNSDVRSDPAIESLIASAGAGASLSDD